MSSLLVSQSLSKIESVTLPLCTCLFFGSKHGFQLRYLLENINKTKSVPLKNLNLGATDLRPYCASLLSQSLIKLEYVDFYRSKISAEQLKCLFETLSAMGKKNSLSLKKVKFGGLTDMEDKLEEIPRKTIVEGLTSLVSLDLPNTLNPETIKLFLTNLDNSSRPTLQEVNFGLTDLSSVPATLLVNSILKLVSVSIGTERLFLEHPRITVNTEQVTLLLKTIVNSSDHKLKLKHLRIVCWEDESICSDQLIINAESKLDGLRLFTFCPVISKAAHEA